MDIKALFKVQCGLFITAVEAGGRLNACVTNTLLQQSHVPVRFSITVQKDHLTHDMIMEKRSVGVSVVSDKVTEATIRHFGFASGRDTDKFAQFPYTPDQNGNPLLDGEEIAATVSLAVFETVDVGTHTLFLCDAVEMQDLQQAAITYSQYQAALRNKLNR